MSKRAVRLHPEDEARERLYADADRREGLIGEVFDKLDKIEASTKRCALIRSLETAKLRTCRTQHECALCPKKIGYGDLYVDRGIGRRAHYACVPGLGRAREQWQVDEIDVRLPSAADERAGLRRRYAGEFGNDDDE